jgi:hypothetical protein
LLSGDRIGVESPKKCTVYTIEKITRQDDRPSQHPTNEKANQSSRRKFLSNAAKASVGAAIAVNFPTIVPASVLGKYSPV